MQSILTIGLQKGVDLLQNLTIAHTIVDHLADHGLQGGGDRHCKE